MGNRLLCEVCAHTMELDSRPAVSAAQNIAFIDAHSDHEVLAVCVLSAPHQRKAPPRT